ncbi:MAG: sulfurtransferase-like selenium metabolism protein YedF [Terrisporobacter othiniensis]|uniref:sulfurtransferase-like selenium metabolism protein YedF n=1 Tax=Terrisporobacter othiniensis TaxID=1577792 RepID=UPI00290E8AD8|nr:sulfurtransferase-like selenium metabolism protein YedF [Terrisporobacter othiniensis]MDU6985245.1 sulfurtransferase-like selenium metabolism protein YedF [Terrisporobacter othiniensis]
MNIVKVNAIGDNCPIPVVKAKKAIDALEDAAIVEISVDNEIAVQNVTKMVNQKNLEYTCEKVGQNHYVIKVQCGEVVESEATKEVVATIAKEEKMVVVLSSDKMGEGDEELGKVLIKGFIYAITQLDKYPKAVLLYNSGVKLSSEGSDSIGDLKVLEDHGVEILSCGTCLNFYNLQDKLQVGKVTNMYSIVEELSGATNIIRP